MLLEVVALAAKSRESSGMINRRTLLATGVVLAAAPALANDCDGRLAAVLQRHVDGFLGRDAAEDAIGDRSLAAVARKHRDVKAAIVDLKTIDPAALSPRAGGGFGGGALCLFDP